MRKKSDDWSRLTIIYFYTSCGVVMVDQMLNNRDSHLINGISNLDLNLSLSIVKKVIFDTDRADTEVSFH